MGIVTVPPPMAVLKHTYDNICKMFSTMLAVVVILLLITHQISKVNRLLVLPHSVDTQILQGTYKNSFKEASGLDQFLNLKATLSGR